MKYMKILDIHSLKGPNYWSIYHKLINFRLDIGEYENKPTNEMNGFLDRIKQQLPGLYEHQCSEGKPGGFFERVKRGTWMGHVVEHIALEIQVMAGMNCNYGKTRSTNDKGVYSIVFAYDEERAGIYAAHAAIRIADALAKSNDYDIQADVETLRKISKEDGLGPSTAAIVNAAVARQIPVIRLDKGSFVQLGYGNAQRKIEASITDHTGNIAVDIACDKERTKSILRDASIPVPEGDIIVDKDELLEVIETIGYPLAIKPHNGNQGKGVSLNLSTLNEVMAGFEKAKSYSNEVIVEKYFEGKDFRLLVVNYRFIAAAERTPAMVTGNGFSTILELVDMANLNPSRGDHHETILTRITIDRHTEEFLRFQERNLEDIPRKGEIIYLKRTANLSTGGTSEDITDHVHPEIIAMAERVARTIGLDICGIDFICEDISKPLKAGKGVVIEVNAAPGLRMHTHPYKGKPRPVGEAIVDMLFHRNNNGRIPIVAITGTNGKTTTARLVAHIAQTAGFTVGYTSTTGVYINGETIEEGDCTGPVSSGKVLRDPTVNFAVLECARGGILRAGLAFDQCDVGIVTNVAEDHLDLKDIHTVEEMAQVKAVIPEMVSKDGMAILNENNEHTYRMKDRLKCTVALFSINSYSPRIKEHCKNGGIAAVYRDGEIILYKGNSVVMSERVENIPVAFDGKALFMVENIMAAILAAYAKYINIKFITEALRSFKPTFENMPGRMNYMEFKNFSFLLDYAHNFHGLSALGDFIREHDAIQKVGIVSAVGDRRDIDIFNMGKASAELFDKVIIRIDEDTRGRNENEIVELIYSGIAASERKISVEIIKNEFEAIRHALFTAEPGSLIVLLSENIKEAYEYVKANAPQEKEDRELMLDEQATDEREFNF
jgi:cyanophycin synthetase